MRANPEFSVQVVDDEIIVTLPGSHYSVTYYKSAKSPHLLANFISDRDDPRVAMRLSEFLALAWRLANDKAEPAGAGSCEASASSAPSRLSAFACGQSVQRILVRRTCARGGRPFRKPCAGYVVIPHSHSHTDQSVRSLFSQLQERSRSQLDKPSPADSGALLLDAQERPGVKFTRGNPGAADGGSLSTPSGQAQCRRSRAGRSPKVSSLKSRCFARVSLALEIAKSA